MRALALSSAFAAALLAAPVQATAPVQVLTSPGGVGYWLVEEHAIPMVALEISFEGGAATDPEAQTGAARFLSAMLDEGAGDLDSVAFSTQAQLLAANFSFSAGRDDFSVSARMLSDNLEDSVALLRLALTAPRFDPEPLSRVRGQILSSIRSDEADPNALASKAWFAAAFPDDPYGRPRDGTLETMAALTADDLRAAHARLLTRGGARVGVVGAIGADAAGAMVDALLGALPADPPAPLAPVTIAGAAGVTVIPFDAPQSTVIFGHEGPLRDDPDFIPAYVMNHILGGGGFSSRLTTEVREKRGLAYSTYAYLAPLDRAGLYMGGVGTANERVAESLDVIRDEWRRMAEEGVSAEELRKAKQYLTGAWPLRFDGNAKIAAMLVGLQQDGFGPEYLDQRNGLVEAVTQEDIARVAARWLKPDALRFVVVGQPEGLPAIQ
ncbi:MAG: insulinase family protein [Alphaproteobacteria bacterium]|nr:insulinase family protein [Alphaproteobacteria bacterium]